MKRLLILTNIPVPYKVDFYNELGKSMKLTVVFEAKRLTGQKFNWNDTDKLNFKAYYLSEVLNEHKIHFKIAKFLYNSRFDEFLISAFHTYTGQFALNVLKFRHIKYCFETDGAFIPTMENPFKKMYKHWLISGAKKYFSPCDESDRYLKNYGGVSKKIKRYPFSSILQSEVLDLPISNDGKKLIRSRLGINEEKVIIAVGQFIERKGFDVLLKSLKFLKSSKWGCYIIGGNITDEYKKIIEAVEISKKVKFLNFLDRETLSLFYRASDLFVLPTREDIWGLVVNEAMANGLPVVTTNRCNAGLTMVSDENGKIIPVDDVDALSSAINDILFDDSKLKTMGEKSLQIIKKYTIEEMANAHLKELIV